MSQFYKSFAVFMVVVALFVVGIFGNNSVSASGLQSVSTDTPEIVHLEPTTEISESETVEERVEPTLITRPTLDGEVGTLDYFTVTADYGTPVKNSAVTLSNVPLIASFQNRSTSTVRYQETHTVSFSSTWNASAGVSIDVPKLNLKLNSQLGVTGGKSYSYQRLFDVSLAPGKGIQVKRLYQKYTVPTYKVTKYSASMGGHSTRAFVGNTIVYVPIGMRALDF